MTAEPEPAGLSSNAEDRGQLQLERLQSTLNRAFKTVPFHRRRFSAVMEGGTPVPVETLGELSALPFMKRRDLGEHYPYGLFAVPLRDIVRIHTAAGATLNPTVSGYTAQDLSLWRRIVAAALTAAGVTPHDILQISLDWGLANWGRDYKDGAETLGASVIPNTPLSLDKQIMVLRDYKTSVLITTPSSAAQLAAHIHRIGLSPTALNLKTLILVGSPADRAFRERLADRLHVETWLHYGLSEVPGPAMAFECPEHNGLHVNTDHFLPEIIDPQTGNPRTDDGPGELTLTTLTTRAFPLIRFRTGDGARWLSGACPCGASFPRIHWLPQRTDEMINIEGVKVHHRQIQHHLEAALGVVPDFSPRIRIREDEPHCLEVQVVIDDRLFSDEIKVLENLVRTAETRLHETLGVRVAIRLKERSSDPDRG